MAALITARETVHHSAGLVDTFLNVQAVFFSNVDARQVSVERFTVNGLAVPLKLVGGLPVYDTTLPFRTMPYAATDSLTFAVWGGAFVPSLRRSVALTGPVALIEEIPDTIGRDVDLRLRWEPDQATSELVEIGWSFESNGQLFACTADITDDGAFVIPKEGLSRAHTGVLLITLERVRTVTDDATDSRGLEFKSRAITSYVPFLR